jgi:hydrogenase maturation factor
MCIGAVDELVDAWEEGGARVGRLGCGAVVPLAFVPEARAGDRLLVHLGIPVEVLAPETATLQEELR